VTLAAGFCIFKGNADPRQLVRSDVGIPIHLVAAHKEVAVDRKTRTIYGRKSDPDFDGPDPTVNGALTHGFSVKGSVRLIDTFRDQVHARMTRGKEDVSIVDDDTKNYLDRQFESIRDRMDRTLQRVGGTRNSVYNNDNQETSGTSSCPRRCLPPPRRRRRRPRSSPTSWPGSGTAWAFDSRRFRANPELVGEVPDELRGKPWCREHPDLDRVLVHDRPPTDHRVDSSRSLSWQPMTGPIERDGSGGTQ
jgi:hypothetical protein